jgi:hypothetical protein
MIDRPPSRQQPFPPAPAISPAPAIAPVPAIPPLSPWVSQTHPGGEANRFPMGTVLTFRASAADAIINMATGISEGLEAEDRRWIDVPFPAVLARVGPIGGRQLADGITVVAQMRWKGPARSLRPRPQFFPLSLRVERSEDGSLGAG